MSQVIIGYTTEGTTDVRFLESILQRTFELVGFECRSSVEVLPLIHIPKQGGAFVEQVLQRCIEANDQGIMIFCVHIDADATNDNHVFETRINPLLNALRQHLNEEICNNIVPVIPVQMTEAWMLADIGLLKAEIGTDIRNVDLGLHRAPESIANPKNTIEEAIRIARQTLVSRRRRELTIGELYQPIGQKIGLEKLELLPSYQKFKQSIRLAYQAMNYL